MICPNLRQSPEAAGHDMGTAIDDSMPWLGAATDDEVKRVVEALYRVHRLTTVITDLDSLLTRIAEESSRVAQAEACSLLLYDEKTDEIYFRVAIGEEGDQEALRTQVRLKMGQGIAGAAAAQRNAINVEDAETDPRVYRQADAASDFHTRSLLAVPMIDRDCLVGVLEVVNKIEGGAFTPFDMHVMAMFSSLAAGAIVSARLVEEHVRNERLAAIGQAVAGLSHYTKNIVTGLSSSAELIEMGLNAGNTEMLRRSFPVFQRSTKRISNFVQDLLSFSRSTAPYREDCKLGDIVREVQETYAELFTSKSIHLTVDTSKAKDTVKVDGQAIYRCLLNLVTNAADAVPEGLGRVTLRACTTPEGAAEVDVIDTGPGVPREVRNSIFDPFFSTKGSRGTGLGLAVTQKIIREHGGELTVGDAPTGGALFHITLPAWQPREDLPR